MTWFSSETLLHTVVNIHILQICYSNCSTTSKSTNEDALAMLQNQVYAINSSIIYIKCCFLQVPISARFNGLFLTTFSCSQTPVLQTVATIPHIPLCRNGHSNMLLTDHLCISFRYMLYWTFILAGVTGTVKTAQAPCCANMKKNKYVKGYHLHSVLCVMSDIWNRSWWVTHSFNNSNL